MQLRSNSVFKPTEDKENLQLKEFKNKSTEKYAEINLELTKLSKKIVKFSQEISELFTMLDEYTQKKDILLTYGQTVIVNKKMIADIEFFRMIFSNHIKQIKDLIISFSENILQETHHKKNAKENKDENPTLLKKFAELEKIYTDFQKVLSELLLLGKEERNNLFQNVINCVEVLKKIILDKISEKEIIILNPPKEESTSCVIC